MSAKLKATTRVSPIRNGTSDQSLKINALNKKFGVQTAATKTP